MLLRNIGLVVLMSAMLVLAQDNPNLRQQINTKDRTREFAEAFLNTLVTQRPFDAFSMLRSVTPESENEIEATRQSTEQLLDQVRPGYGKMIGFEQLDVKSLGQSFVRYDYLLKMERNALHCRIVFYRPKNTWVPVMLNFSDDLTQLFDDLAK
jgi:hypothetical protein